MEMTRVQISPPQTIELPKKLLRNKLFIWIFKRNLLVWYMGFLFFGGQVCTFCNLWWTWRSISCRVCSKAFTCKCSFGWLTTWVGVLAWSDFIDFCLVRHLENSWYILQLIDFVGIHSLVSSGYYYHYGDAENLVFHILCSWFIMKSLSALCPHRF